MKKSIFLLALLAASGAWAANYKWTDAEGKVHYTDKPPPPGIESQTLRSVPHPGAAASAVEQKSRQAKLEDADALPYLDDDGHNAYKAFLKLPSPRAFVLCKDGRYSAFSGATEEAVESDVKKAILPNKIGVCRVYARNNDVVW